MKKNNIQEDIIERFYVYVNNVMFVLYFFIVLFALLDPRYFSDPYFIPADSFLAEEPLLAHFFYLVLILWFLRIIFRKSRSS